MREYPSLDEFIFDNSLRFHSLEADYGVMWRDGLVDWPHWRVSYIRATGEVCAFEQGTRPWNRVRVLGVVEPDWLPGINGTWYAPLDAILLNWADPDVNGKFSLAWLEEKLATRCRHCGHAITRTPPPNSTWVDRNGFPVCVKARDLLCKPVLHEPMAQREGSR